MIEITFTPHENFWEGSSYWKAHAEDLKRATPEWIEWACDQLKVSLLKAVSDIEAGRTS